MKIKLLVSRASSTGSQNRGDEIEVGDAEALRMIEAGQAQSLEPIKPAAAKPGATKKATIADEAAAGELDKDNPDRSAGKPETAVTDAAAEKAVKA